MKIKAFKTSICGLLLGLICFTNYSFGITYQNQLDSTNTGFKLKTIVVDAGHGGHDPGAYGSFSMEKNVTLAIAFKLQQAIQKDLPDVNVVMTRTTDEFVELHKRSEIANKAKGNIFISIHCNSLADSRSSEIVDYTKGRHGKKTPVYKTVVVHNHSGKGVLVLVYGFKRTGEQLEAIRENASILQEKNYKDYYADDDDPTSAMVLNAFRDKYRKQSIHLANLINSEFTDTDGRYSNGVKEQSLHVLANSGMPAVLVETGFINNAEEEEYLNSDNGQTEVVNSIVRAIKQYKRELEQKAQPQ
ncbi:N-acetylmuramoyl-L-alanine amidase [Mucilaginibacter robiniae]|uniref:N-acetylmuramoyl-L-alanine amidase n=1 Tax=Mucilaginibacter robiniae TaxID=2728022 RepID=A0A7L5EAA4_9SPHI|nr:N-acetylmuramoyl-L-alanine amidase [Mucilaginibacter robiniae]QJD97843.1 N-acetylmuramoyl-L-alanine amidase [Mucilaginibacter robiniae]